MILVNDVSLVWLIVLVYVGVLGRFVGFVVFVYVLVIRLFW